MEQKLLDPLTRTTILLADRAWDNVQRQFDDWSRVVEGVPEKPTTIIESYVIYSDEKEHNHD